MEHNLNADVIAGFGVTTIGGSSVDELAAEAGHDTEL